MTDSDFCETALIAYLVITSHHPKLSQVDRLKAAAKLAEKICDRAE